MTPVAASALIHGAFDEDKLTVTLRELREKLRGGTPSLAFVFMSPVYFTRAEEVLEIIRVEGHVPLVIGCSGQGLVGVRQEMEGFSGISLLLLSLPDASVRPVHFKQNTVELDAGDSQWREQVGLAPGIKPAWIAFADPFHLDAVRWLDQWNHTFPKCPVFGGLASGETDEESTQVYLNGDVHTEGAVALALEGGVEFHPVVSQGCRPVGESWVVTHAEKNIIYKLGGRPAYEVLVETVNELSDDLKPRLAGNLFMGMVTNEYQEEFHQGDFLIRHIMGADEKSGALAVGTLIHTGQTIQFHLRDSQSADEDLHMLLNRKKKELSRKKLEAVAAILCCCNGRGQSLFGRPHHDATVVAEVFGEIPLAGFFCNGEIGPIGDRNFIHGYTASVGILAVPATNGRTKA